MASRKNFPGRLEARRFRAAERNEAQARAQQRQLSPLHVQNEPPNDVVDRYIPIAKPVGSAPIPPTLKEFGLSKDDLKRLAKPWFRNSIPGTREVYTYLVVDVLVFFLLFHRGIHFSFGYI